MADNSSSGKLKTAPAAPPRHDSGMTPKAVVSIDEVRRAADEYVEVAAEEINLARVEEGGEPELTPEELRALLKLRPRR